MAVLIILLNSFKNWGQDRQVNIENFFPTGIVTGDAFCNREHELALLNKRFHQNAHVVLISPRRYGKSSLIAQFALKTNMINTAVDLLPAASSRYVCNAIIDAVSLLVDRILPKPKKIKEKVLSYFAIMHPVIEISAFGQRVKLTMPEKTDEETIMKLLLSLDQAAIAVDKKLMFVMDEFQQIANLEASLSLEASIRHAVERSQNVFYVFSGSNRTLLESMFKSKERPLYHLCDEIKIRRISNSHYHQFIPKAAQLTWRRTISQESIEQILLLTQSHPYYVNRLCRLLWDLQAPPTDEQVRMIWYQYVKSQKEDWASDMISQLTVNQRLVCAALAKLPMSEINGKSLIKRLGLPNSSIQRTVETLLKKDIIFQDQQEMYQVLNPVIKTILSSDPYFNL